jgi:hypothetical protein
LRGAAAQKEVDLFKMNKILKNLLLGLKQNLDRKTNRATVIMIVKMMTFLLKMNSMIFMMKPRLLAVEN